MTGLRARDRRALLLGLLVIGGLWAALRGVPWLAAWRAREIDRAVALRAQASRAAVVLAQVARPAGTLAASAGFDALVFQARTLAEASSELAALITEHAEAMGVQLSVLEPRVDSAQNSPLSRVRVRCEGQSDIAGVAGLLALIESEERVLRVPRLAVVASNPQDEDTVPELLRIEIVVEAMVLVTTRVVPANAGIPPDFAPLK
ncbi:MAG: GspMb/PilO family protein [Gemmatimonadaceae bacterium]